MSIWPSSHDHSSTSMGVEKSKNVTENPITKNRKISYANVFKALKKKDVKEWERKDIRTYNMKK